MQSTSELFREILRDPLHTVEVLADVSGVSYSGDRIVECRTFGQLLENPEAPIGNCLARQLDLSILPRETVPRKAEIRLFARVSAGGRSSEWLPRGTFFTSRRESDTVTGIVTLHAYDAMLKAGAVWLTSDYDGETWPMPVQQAVEDIARRMGVELDPRTVLDPAFPVQYPVDDKGDMTMADVLSRIAVANAGNWTITNAGRLLLVPLSSAPAPTSYLVTEYGEAITFGGARILI